MKKPGIILILLLLAFVSPTYAQKTKGKSKQQLQSEITSLQKEISTANQLLKKTTKDKEMTLNEVSILDSKIKQREKLITSYNEQIAVLDEEIKSGQSNIKSLNSDLSKLQKEYAKMIVFANKNRSHYDRLGFIFASKDFNQAFRRLRYIREFSEARKAKMNQIAAIERQISSEVEAHQQARMQQDSLLKDEKSQQNALQKEKKELNGQVAKLKKKEGSIQQDIKNKQQQAKKLQKAIDDIIAEEIRKANAEAERKRKEEAKKNASKGKTTTTAPKEKGMALTPAEKTLSTNFVNNKGKLPWPVAKGAKVGDFGSYPHPDVPSVMIENRGIDILVEPNTPVRAVFQGEVTGVLDVMGTKVLMIRHGEYLSVYQNLASVSVKKGDKVNTKQSVGTVARSSTNNTYELHFEVWKNNVYLNPNQWLSGK
jgi:septal ring factor EnvC (AmiA/AmiB activator)